MEGYIKNQENINNVNYCIVNIIDTILFLLDVDIIPNSGPYSPGTIIDTISCPQSATSLFSCSFGITNTGECISHDNVAYIQCLNCKYSIFMSHIVSS